MRTALFTKSLADNRRSMIAWAVGCAVVGIGYASTYPDQKNNTDNLPEAMRDALHIDATAAGYLHATVFGLILPLLALVYGVAAGSRATAADEESGQLDLVLAHPVTRTKLVLQRFASVAVGAAAIAFLVWLALLSVRDSAELTSITPGEFLAQCAHLFLLAITFAALAFAIGAAFGSKAAVLVGATVVGVLGYIAHTMAAQIGADWLANLSPFHYYIGGEPLRNGFQWGDASVLLIASALLLAAGTYRFNHRDANS
ncbi:ABC transporter permease subunit [Streptomyces sp. O3]